MKTTEQTTNEQLPDYRACPDFLLDLLDFRNLEIGNLALSGNPAAQIFRARKGGGCLRAKMLEVNSV